jgi:hypothetical protein
LEDATYWREQHSKSLELVKTLQAKVVALEQANVQLKSMLEMG